MNNKSKQRPPKILIVTQIHPINIASVYDYISHSFIQNNEVFSPQIMALLGELTLKENASDFKHSYRVLNAAFVKNIKAAIKKMNTKKPWIIVGNCSKDSKIKFDHIIGFDGGEDYGNTENFDYYIKRDNELLQEADMEINYYTKKDVEYFFPTMEHLKLFLTTLGLKEEERKTNGNTAERSTTEGSI